MSTVTISVVTVRRIPVNLGLLALAGMNSESFNHLNQVGQRVCLHLLHRPAAVNLYCVFCGSDLSRDLLVEHACDHHSDDLTLSGAQRVEAFAQHCELRLLLASHPVPSQSRMNGIQEILVVEGLGEKLHGPRLHGSYRHRDVVMRSDENDRNLNIGFGELALQSESADPRQPDIEDEATGHVWKIACEELLCGSERLHLQTYGSDEALDRTTNRGIVVHNENDGIGFAHETAAAASV